MEKHERYGSAYRRFGFYWGIGVEHETYLATSQTRRVAAFTPQSMRPERYSVNYYKAYKPEALTTALAVVGPITVPVLMNSHSFSHCDVFGEHATTYEKTPTPNPRFSGKTFFDWLCEYSAWLRDEYGRVYVWDGDTVEFMTQRFYRATVSSVISELEEAHRRFLAEINAVPRSGLLAAYGPLRLAAPENYPWATHLTNPRAVSMFNNGTIHVNLTMPTRLGFNRRPLCFTDFTERHRRLARLIQWLEPLWIAQYGSGDPLPGRFAAGSQRLAVSRYIGVGTFDTNTMPRGKILQIPKPRLPWYEVVRDRTEYDPLCVVGLDLNFNKHWAHGLEVRFLDQMPIAGLREILQDMVVLMDVAETSVPVTNPCIDVRWQGAAAAALLEGRSWRVEPEYRIAIATLFGFDGDQKEPESVSGTFTWLRAGLKARRARCWRWMVEGRPQRCWSGCVASSSAV